MDGNDLLSYWPALGECEAAPCALQTWGSERRLGLDTSKDAANNNQPDLALTSGDETSLGRAQRQRKGMILDLGLNFRDPRGHPCPDPGDSSSPNPSLLCGDPRSRCTPDIRTPALTWRYPKGLSLPQLRGIPAL